MVTIKHDGQDFNSDNIWTDTYKHKKAGAYGRAIFSKNKLNLIGILSDLNDVKFNNKVINLNHIDEIASEVLNYMHNVSNL